MKEILKHFRAGTPHADGMWATHNNGVLYRSIAYPPVADRIAIAIMYRDHEGNRVFVMRECTNHPNEEAAIRKAIGGDMLFAIQPGDMTELHAAKMRLNVALGQPQTTVNSLSKACEILSKYKLPLPVPRLDLSHEKISYTDKNAARSSWLMAKRHKLKTMALAPNHEGTQFRRLVGDWIGFKSKMALTKYTLMTPDPILLAV